MQEFFKTLQEQRVLKERRHRIEQSRDGLLAALNRLHAEHQRTDRDGTGQQARGHPEQNHAGDGKTDKESQGLTRQHEATPRHACLAQPGAGDGEALAAEVAMPVQADLLGSFIFGHDRVVVGGVAI